MAISAANRPEVLVLFAAASRLGAIFTPLHHRWGTSELEAALAAAAPTVLLVDPERAELARTCGAEERVGVVVTLESEYDPSFGGLAAAEGVATESAVAPDDPGLLVFTSGTTGEPRGVAHTWRNILWNHRQFIDELNLGAADRNFCPAPLAHVGGLGVATGPSMYRGGTTVLTRSFDAPAAVERMQEEDVTVAFMVPAMWRRLLEAGYESDESSSMRFGVVGGAPVSPELVGRAKARGLHLVQGYGMTEAGPMVSLLDAEQPGRHARSVGRPGMHVAVRVVDEAGEEVERGESGELMVAGPNVADGYWRAPEATGRSFVDGWFQTGDVGRRRADGEIEFLGRRDDRFVSGGENIHPAEVESVLEGHSGVEAAGVVGLPDPDWGEAAVAVVAPVEGDSPDLEVLRRHVRAELADFKAPRRLAVVDGLPRNATGKVRRRALRANLESGEIAIRERVDE